MLDWLLDWLNAFLTWLVELLLWLPLQLWDLLLDGLEAFFLWLPVPSFFTTASASLAGIPGEVAYFAEALALGPGLTLIFSAYVIRFVIRRLPVVG